MPVGEDQLPHMELTRKIARRFNALYGGGQEMIKVPEAMVSATPRLPGLTAAQKWGKSAGNAIYLSDDTNTVAAKVNMALTDPGRIRVPTKEIRIFASSVSTIRCLVQRSATKFAARAAAEKSAVRRASRD